MGEVAIDVHHISKRYTIGRSNAVSLRESVGNTLGRLFQSRPSSQEFWALRDLDFRINAGEVVGIVGKNGAGKSTLLKIISRITKPTSGKVEIYGRIASLLEVGTGFHPELTGRENIFLNGTILGMSRTEVHAKLEEIVEFSGISKFIDTPVKRYSSGMSVRLAFAVAAHLEPEILIIDEVLAVGDAEFQKKCLGKMGEVSQKEGRTILFVSHSLPALKAICNQGILLEKGQMVMQADIQEVIRRYSSSAIDSEAILPTITYYAHDLFEVKGIWINGSELAVFILDEPLLRLKVMLEIKKKTPFELDLHIKKEDHLVASYANFVKNEVPVWEPGIYMLEYSLPLPDLLSGHYQMDLYFTEPFVKRYAGTVNAIRFEMVNAGHSPYLNVQGMTWGQVLVDGKMEVRRVD